MVVTATSSWLGHEISRTRVRRPQWRRLPSGQGRCRASTDRSTPPGIEVRRSMAEIVLINPRFEVSYWGLEHALPLLGKRANMPVASLPLLAALTPPGHSVTLLDENIEAIDLDRCARADIVGLTGMVVQRERMRQLLDRAQAAGGVRRGGRAVGHGQGRRLRGPGGRHLRRRGRADLAPVPRGMGAGGAQASLRAGRADRHDDGADAAVRPAEDAALPLRQRPVLARLPVPVRVLRHHRDLRPQAETQDEPRRSSPSSTPCAPRASGAPSSSTTT